MGSIASRLQELQIELPPAAAPAGNYLPYVREGGLVFIAGQLPLKDGKPHYRGKVGAEVSVEQAIEAARLCGVNILAQLAAACDGDLDRVRRCLKLGGFVNAGADFAEHPKIVNGCSDLMVAVFGDAGRHARFAVGAPSLPFDAPVEIDAIFAVT